jgi:hypothetical protein
VLAVFGVSVGFNNLSLQAALYSAAWHEEMGAASGLFMTSRCGTILSTSLLGVAFGQHIGVAQPHVVAIVLAVLGALVLAQRASARRRCAATEGRMRSHQLAVVLRWAAAA